MAKNKIFEKIILCIIFCFICFVPLFFETTPVEAATKTPQQTYSSNIIAEPKIGTKIYSGNLLKAYVPSSNYYEVTENNGGIDVGFYDVKVKLKDPTTTQWANHSEEEITLKFQITEGVNNIYSLTFTNKWQYGEQPGTPTITAKFDAQNVVFEYKAFNYDDNYYSTEIPTAVGKYVIRATIPESPNYQAVNKTRDFEITKKELSISGITVAPKQYDGTTSVEINTDNMVITGIKPGEESMVNIQVTGTFTQPDVSEEAVVNLSYTINGACRNNYTISDIDENGIVDVQKTIITAITPHEVEVIWSYPATLTYNATNLLGSITAKFLDISSQEVLLTLHAEQNQTQVDFVNAGEYSVVAEFNSGNYTSSNLIKTITINQKELEVVWHYPTKLVYDKSEKIISAHINNIETYDEESFAFSVALVGDNKNVSQQGFYYEIESINNSNYFIPTAFLKSETKYITQKEISITGWELKFGHVLNYDGTAKKLIASYSGIIDGDDCRIVGYTTSGDLINVTEEGFQYTISGLTNPNYMLPVNITSPTMKITPISIDVNIDNKQSIEGEQLVALTYSIGEQVLLDGNQIIGTPATSARSDAPGVYRIKQGTLSVSTNNYSLNIIEGEYLVFAKTLYSSLGSANSVSASIKLETGFNPVLKFIVEKKSKEDAINFNFSGIEYDSFTHTSEVVQVYRAAIYNTHDEEEIINGNKTISFKPDATWQITNIENYKIAIYENGVLQLKSLTLDQKGYIVFSTTEIGYFVLVKESMHYSWLTLLICVLMIVLITIICIIVYRVKRRKRYNYNSSNNVVNEILNMQYKKNFRR